jgi:hypothetical protein
MPVKMSVLVLYVVTLCGLAGSYQHFGEVYSLQPLRWREHVSLKLWNLPTSPRSVTTQKTNADILLYLVIRILEFTRGTVS